MDKELTITPLLVNHQPKPNPTSWVKIFIYEPAEAEVLATRGRMYAVLSVSSTVPVDFTPVMQLILEELHNHYFQQPAGGILQTLESTLDEIHKKLLLMGQQDKRLSAGFSFNLLTAVSWGTVLYFGQLGASRASLLRKNNLYDIDEGQTKTTDLYLSSGLLMPEDRIILGTGQLFDQIGKDKLQACLAASPNDMVKQLEEQLSAGPLKQMQSAIILTVDIKQVPSYEEEAVQILDPASIPELANAAPNAKHQVSQVGANLAHLPGRLWHWRLFGKVPGLPLVVGLLIAVALATSIYWNMNHHGRTAGAVSLEPLIAQIASQLDQARQVATVNPDRSQDFLDQAQQGITDGLSTQPDSPELQQLQQQQAQIQDQINIATPIKQAKALTDLQIDPTQARLAVKDKQVWLIDAKANKLVSVNATGVVQTKAISPAQLSQPILGASDSKLVVVSGTKAYNLNPDGAIGPAVNLPASTKSLSLAGYKQNTYLLDGVGQVLRIPASANNTTSPPTTYFKQPIDGSSLVDLGVDGSVYLLRQQGQVDVYLNGQKQNFALERSSLATKAKAIFVSESRDKIYLLTDTALLYWNKAGKYQGQVYLPNKAQIQMAGIDFSSQTLYILAEGKLLKADLP